METKFYAMESYSIKDKKGIIYIDNKSSSIVSGATLNRLIEKGVKIVGNPDNYINDNN
jgi:hypothetical protein